MKIWLYTFWWFAVIFVGFILFIHALSDAFYAPIWSSCNAAIDGVFISIGIILITKGTGKVLE